MAAAVKGAPDAELAAYLAYQTAGAMALRPQSLGYSQNALPAVTETAKSLLELRPDCFDVYDTLGNALEFDLRRSMSTQAPMVFATTVPSRLRQTPGMPETLPEDLTESIDQLMASDQQQLDVSEPSLTVIGRSLREIQFLQTYRQLRFLSRSLSVPIDDQLEAMLPAVNSHPYRPVLEAVGYPRSANVYQVTRRTQEPNRAGRPGLDELVRAGLVASTRWSVHERAVVLLAIHLGPL